MLDYNNSYMGDPFSVGAEGEAVVITQETDESQHIVIPVEDVEDLIRKINHMKNEIIAAKVREANRELFL